MPHYKTKRTLDANHIPIVKALKQIGASVIECDKLGNDISDIIASLSPRQTVAIELKTETGVFDIPQLRWLATFKGYSAFASNELEAINAVRFPEAFALSERDKLLVLRIVLKYEADSKVKRPRISVSKFEKEFAQLRGEK